jgi:hypothetical protein
MIEQKERKYQEKEQLLAVLAPKLAELGKMKSTPLLTFILEKRYCLWYWSWGN